MDHGCDANRELSAVFLGSFDRNGWDRDSYFFCRDNPLLFVSLKFRDGLFHRISLSNATFERSTFRNPELMLLNLTLIYLKWIQHLNHPFGYGFRFP